MNLEELTVENLKQYSDNRGVLMPVEFGDLPFVPQRIFSVVQYGSFQAEKKVRGKHANRQCQQYFYCMAGKVEVSLFDGKQKHWYNLLPGMGLFIDKMIWNCYLCQSDPGQVSLYTVLASHPYDGADYITNLEQFIKLTNQ